MENPRILVDSKNVISLIPQKYPVIMVDTLYECSAEKAITGFTIIRENMFCENGLFSEYGIIENIAQSAALKAKYEEKTNISTSATCYICSIKNCAIHYLPSVGDKLMTTISILSIVGDVAVLHGQVECDGKIVAESEMKVIFCTC